jgi:response regulator RpfG family c-di-GMP phosphodiesterase
MQTRAVRFLGVAPRVTGTESVAWHHVNVTMLALGFGAELGLPLPQLQALAERAFLHDVGMYGVPEEVLLRTGRLSPADNEALLAARRRSAWFPFERLGPAQRAAAWASTAVEFGLDWGEVDEAGRARQVHEIGLVGGIISLAKTYDALTSRRGYREAMTPAEALGAMQSRTYQRFRPDLLPLFITFLQRVTPKPPPAAGR